MPLAAGPGRVATAAVLGEPGALIYQLRSRPARCHSGRAPDRLHLLPDLRPIHARGSAAGLCARHQDPYRCRFADRARLSLAEHLPQEARREVPLPFAGRVLHLESALSRQRRLLQNGLLEPRTGAHRAGADSGCRGDASLLHRAGADGLPNRLLVPYPHSQPRPAAQLHRLLLRHDPALCSSVPGLVFLDLAVLHLFLLPVEPALSVPLRPASALLFRLLRPDSGIRLCCRLVPAAGRRAGHPVPGARIGRTRPASGAERRFHGAADDLVPVLHGGLPSDPT